jgi:protein CrcB
VTDTRSLVRRLFGDRLAVYLAVGAGAAIGGVLRAGVSLGSIEVLGPAFPWGTLAANVLGSFVIGFYAELSGPDGRLIASGRQRQFVMAGICGGFTTFSVFSLESSRLLASGDLGLAAANIGGSVIVWLLAVWAGHTLAMRLNRLNGRRQAARPDRERIDEMQLPEQALVLRIYIGEDDRDDGRPLYEAIVLKAREMHLAGATVIRGALGYGHSSRLHTSKILRLSEDMPLVIEIVDSEEKIEAFLPELDRLMTSGLITLENIRVLQYGSQRNGRAG